MTTNRSQWIAGPKKVSVVVDNDSWILPYAKTLVGTLESNGHHCVLCRTHEEIGEGDIAFYLGCVRITPDSVLKRNSYNLVVHESDLPSGRGFSPLTWQILSGDSRIPVCLIEASAEVDAGLIYDRAELSFEGHELSPELRDQQGQRTIELCERFCARKSGPIGEAQSGEASYFRRRHPRDSELDVSKSIASQFPLLRVVDNIRYPAFFHYAGHRYRIQIEKDD